MLGVEATQALEISCTKRQAVSGHHSHCERVKARMSKCLLLGHRRGWECKGSTHPCNTWAAPKTHALGSWELCQSRTLHSQSWGISGSLRREINLVNRWQSHHLRGAGELIPCRRHRDKKFYCHRANEDHFAGPRLEDCMGRARDSSTAKSQGKQKIMRGVIYRDEKDFGVSTLKDPPLEGPWSSFTAGSASAGNWAKALQSSSPARDVQP